MAKTVALMRNFREDGRTSMDVYADSMMLYLPRHAEPGVRIKEFVPRLSPLVRALPNAHNLRMRVARYLSYPIQASRVKADVYHIVEPGYAQLVEAIGGERTILTVHDIIPLLAWKGLIPGVTYNHAPRVLEKILRRNLNRVAALIAVSTQTKRDLIQHLGCDEKRIEVIYQGVAPEFRALDYSDQDVLRRSFGFPEKDVPVVLITGETVSKNHAVALRAVCLVEDRLQRPLQVVKLGRSYPGWQKCINGVKLRRPVLELQNLPLPRLIDLYNAVDCLFFPSAYEGFGLPPLEAMACGTPVISSTAASLPEIVGDAAAMAAPEDTAGLAEALARVISDSTFRNDLVRRGFCNITRFSWDTTARQTLNVYRRMANKPWL